MADYYAIIAELNPLPEQIEEAKAYALEQITEQVLESDPSAIVSIHDNKLSITDGTTDFIHAMQDEFENFFESKLKQLMTDS